MGNKEDYELGKFNEQTQTTKTSIRTVLVDESGNVVSDSNPITTQSSNKALQLIESGSYIYIGKATIGSDTADAVWQVRRIDETSGLVILWADGNDNYDNVWDNYSSLSYS